MARNHITAQEAQKRLRDVGSPEVAAVSARFFKTGPEMPRTMLRYAIEKFPERKRQMYLGVAASEKK